MYLNACTIIGYATVLLGRDFWCVDDGLATTGPCSTGVPHPGEWSECTL